MPSFIPTMIRQVWERKRIRARGRPQWQQPSAPWCPHAWGSDSHQSPGIPPVWSEVNRSDFRDAIRNMFASFAEEVTVNVQVSPDSWWWRSDCRGRGAAGSTYDKSRCGLQWAPGHQLQHPLSFLSQTLTRPHHRPQSQWTNPFLFHLSF